jgi:hypothetical protein
MGKKRLTLRYGTKRPVMSSLLCCWDDFFTRVAEPHHFYAAPALSKIFDMAPVAPAPTLLYSKAKFL